MKSLSLYTGSNSVKQKKVSEEIVGELHYTVPKGAKTKILSGLYKRVYMQTDLDEQKRAELEELIRKVGARVFPVI